MIATASRHVFTTDPLTTLETAIGAEALRIEHRCAIDVARRRRRCRRPEARKIECRTVAGAERRQRELLRETTFAAFDCAVKFYRCDCLFIHLFIILKYKKKK